MEEIRDISDFVMKLDDRNLSYVSQGVIQPSQPAGV